MQYQWLGGHGVYGDAEEIFRHLEHLRSQDDLTLDVLERDATKRSSPLHDRLEWNDSEAARRFRRTQLRTILNKLVKVNERGETRRIYVGVGGGDDPRHYDLVERVMRKPAMRRVFARRALNELSSFHARYGNIPEVADVLKTLRRSLKPVLNPAMARLDASEES